MSESQEMATIEALFDDFEEQIDNEQTSKEIQRLQSSINRSCARIVSRIERTSERISEIASRK